MLLVDTTVWIDFFAGRSAAHVAALQKSIEEDEDICLCGVILTEVLQGIRADSDYRKVRTYFEALTFLPIERATFVRAADMYRSLRRKGLTIRNAVDCMIAAVAIEHNVPLLHNDRDFDCIASQTQLKIAKIG